MDPSTDLGHGLGSELGLNELSALAPIVKHLGAYGSALVLALILGFRLLKSYLEYKQARDSKTGSDHEALTELIDTVAENEAKDTEEEKAIIDSVKSLTQEIDEIKDSQIEIRRELMRIQRMLLDRDEGVRSNSHSDSHPLDP